ncbi:hypothetical protein GF327_02310 [Candidatus Woesearchaeota archaeon]|nr:hypothetical protein [Candidatus Woesearchaeota archaeon]
MDLEVKRQIFHMIVGVIIVFVLNINSDIVDKYFEIVLLIIIITGLFLSMVSKRIKIPVFSDLLKEFDRKSDIREFPGKGPFYYLVGVYFTVMIFSTDIASAAILILAFGDSISHLIGKYFGKTKMIIHPEKLLEGTIAGIIAATLFSSIFVGIISGFIASTITMFIEAAELEYFKIDDNFFIPVLAGLILSILK